MVQLIASALVAVARMTRAPPNACSAAAGSSPRCRRNEAAPSSRASGPLSRPRAMAIVRKPIFAVNCVTRWPSSPMPRTATVSPPRARLFLKALKVVIPAQSSGAASSDLRSSGIRQALDWRDHIFTVPAIHVDAGYSRIRAIDKGAAAAGNATAAITGEPAHADALTGRHPVMPAPTTSITPATS